MDFYSVLLEENKTFCSSQWFIHEGFFKTKQIFHGENQKTVLTRLRSETGSNFYYFWSFTMHSLSSTNFFLRPWFTSTPFYSKRARYSVHLNVLSEGEFLKRSNFFIDETEKVVLPCLRLELRSNIHYFWSFIMQSVSSSIIFLQPLCTFTPSYPKRARYSVHLSDSSKGDVVKRSSFFIDVHGNVVLTSLRLETPSNIHYFWSFTMHSLSPSISFLRSRCTSTPFFSRRTRYSVHLSDSSMGNTKKRSNFFMDENKKWF